MPDTEISTLEPVNLRTVWAEEAQHFTPWLAQSENLARLGEALGITMEPHGTEQAVGGFSADILCRRLDGGGDDESWVVIENQYGRTNHDHLGKLLTYTAGLNARTVVWIAEEFRDEHRAALDLLNASTSGEYAYFGVEIELLRIDGSRPAPRFNIVVQPNDWAKTTKATTRDEGKLTATQKMQLEFWTGLSELMETDGTVSCGKPRPHAYMTHSVGVSGVRVVSSFSTYNSAREDSSIGELRVALEFLGRDRQRRFDELSEVADVIGSHTGKAYLWQPWESDAIQRVMIRKDADIEDRSQWSEFQTWLHTEVRRVVDVMVPKVREIA